MVAESIFRIEPKQVRDLRSAVTACLKRMDRRSSRRQPPADWSIAAYDPNELLACFPSLRLRPGFRLAAYQFFEGGNGNGLVFAVQEERSIAKPGRMKFGFAPTGAGITVSSEELPSWADTSIGRYLDGDGSPISYFEASLFQREAAELGAMWHGCTWSTHRILTEQPEAFANVGRSCNAAGIFVPGPMQPPDAWEWVEKRPDDWRPVVVQQPDTPTMVEFYTHSALGQIGVYHHRDTYDEEYRFETERIMIARGGEGFYF